MLSFEFIAVQKTNVDLSKLNSPPSVYLELNKTAEAIRDLKQIVVFRLSVEGEIH